MLTKTCKTCGAEFPATNEYFNWQDKSIGRLRCECKECQSKRSKEARERAKEDPQKYNEILQKRRNYYQRTKQERFAYSNSWRRAHRDRVQFYANRRKNERYKEDPVFKWTHTARCAVRRAAKCKGMRDQRSSSFLEDITGLPLLPLHNYLLQTFEDIYGYAWDGVEKVEVDHIIPLCTESTIEGRQRLFHYKNLRLIKAADNKAKRTSLDYEIEVRKC